MSERPTSYISIRLESRRVPDRGGRGVFARARIKAGDVLVAWGGEVVSRSQFGSVPIERVRVSVQIDENLFLVPGIEGPADWINHSCEPNAGMRGQVVLVAMRDIEPGEEVCYDYAMTDGSDYDVLDCHCRAPGCRGRVTGSDWRIPALMDRYAGYFSPYLEKRIERERRRMEQRTRRRAMHR